MSREFLAYEAASTTQQGQAVYVLGSELTHRSQEYIEDLIDSPDTWLLANDGKVVSVGRLSLQEDISVHLETLAVHPKHTGKGHGTEMLERLEDKALDLSGQDRVVVSLFAKMDSDVIRFYENRGYEQTRPQGGRHFKTVTRK